MERLLQFLLMSFSHVFSFHVRFSHVHLVHMNLYRHFLKWSHCRKERVSNKRWLKIKNSTSFWHLEMVSLCARNSYSIHMLWQLDKPWRPKTYWSVLFISRFTEKCVLVKLLYVFTDDLFLLSKYIYIWHYTTILLYLFDS